MSRDVSAIMKRVKSRHTAPELMLRKALWNCGTRYSLKSASLPGKPDVVFRGRKVAIFVDGDFWHGGQWRKRRLNALEDQFTHTASKNYWLDKIRRNVRRDFRVTKILLRQGWTVLRFWESDIRNNLDGCITMTLETLQFKQPISSIPEAHQPPPLLSFAEFFAGIGLMRIGLEREGWEIAFANDIDPEKYTMYQAHFQDKEPHFVLGDIHGLNGSEIPTATLATASFPCTDLSLAGGRAGLSGEQSGAFWGFIRLLAEMGRRKPPIVLIENVPGFLTSHQGRDFEQALRALNDLGYAVDTFMIDAVQFVPQSRLRLFVVGTCEASIPLMAGESLSSYESALRPRALADFIFSHPSIHWKIRPLPSIPIQRLTLEQILEDLPDNGKEWWRHERATYLLNQMSAKHRDIAETMIQGETWSFGTVFRRVRNGKSMAELRTDGIAGCLRTPRGGSGRQILFKAGFGEYHARLLTPRECARLMGVDDYVVEGPLNRALFGFGDAVCAPVVSWIARYYLNPLVTEMLHGGPIRELQYA